MSHSGAPDRPARRLTADVPGDVPAEADAEKPARVLTGRLRVAVSVAAVLLSLYALWNVFFPVPALEYRIGFLAAVLPMTFLLYRPVLRLGSSPSNRSERPPLTDWALAGASLFVALWPLLTGFDEYISRGFRPLVIDVVCGLIPDLLTWRGLEGRSFL